MKMNKKGFTLIEMLVVIAIIAILVAIIVPTVTSATTKAKAATDAANLRSAKAVAVIGVLDGSITQANSNTTCTAAALKVPDKAKSDTSDTFSCTVTGQDVAVYYGNHAIEYYASIANGDATADTSHDKT